jgi:hypothetical protein
LFLLRLCADAQGEDAGQGDQGFFHENRYVFKICSRDVAIDKYNKNPLLFVEMTAK